MAQGTKSKGVPTSRDALGASESMCTRARLEDEFHPELDLPRSGRTIRLADLGRREAKSSRVINRVVGLGELHPVEEIIELEPDWSFTRSVMVWSFRRDMFQLLTPGPWNLLRVRLGLAVSANSKALNGGPVWVRGAPAGMAGEPTSSHGRRALCAGYPGCRRRQRVTSLKEVIPLISQPSMNLPAKPLFK